jgi:hypothetical protein
MAKSAVLQRQGGRRIKKVPKGERTQIGVIVGGKTKALLLKAMQQSGRTISREAEHLIEKALAYDDMLRAMNTSMEKFAEGKIRETHVPVHTSYGKIWVPKGHPDAPKEGGFEPWTEEEAKSWTERGHPPAKEEAP